MTCDLTFQQEAIDWLFDRHPKGVATQTNRAEQASLSLVPVTKPVSFLVAPDMSDSDLIKQASNSLKFKALFQGVFEPYDSQSEADLAFVSLVSYYTNDASQIDRIFRMSNLYREKWDKHRGALTYGQITIAKALTGESAAIGHRAREKYACASSNIIATPAKHIVNTPAFQFIPAANILAQPKPTPWLIKGMFEQAGLIQLIGATGSAKTFMVIDWACCIATGREWNGNTVSQGAVFYIAGEGHAGFGRRLRAWELQNDTSLATAPFYISTLPAALINVANAEDVATAVNALAVQHCVKPKLIVIDTFARNLGSGDENNNSDASLFINNIDVHLRGRFDAAVLIIHHTGHMEQQRGRGASAMRAAMDSEYLLSINGEFRSLVCTKSKESELGEPINFKLKEITLDGWVDDDGVPMTSAVIIRVEESAPKAKGKSKPRWKGTKKIALEALIQALRDHGTAPSSELVDDIGALLAPTKIVLIDYWRDRAYKSSISTEGSDAQRMAFKRACETLRDAGDVEIWGKECWITGSMQ